MYTFWVTYTHTHREMVDTCPYVFTLPWLWYVQHVWRFCQMFDPLFDMFKVEGNNYNHFNCKITVGKSCFCEIGAWQNADAVFNPAGCLSCRMPTYFFQHGWHKTPFLLLCNYSPAYFLYITMTIRSCDPGSPALVSWRLSTRSVQEHLGALVGGRISAVVFSESPLIGNG